MENRIKAARMMLDTSLMLLFLLLLMLLPSLSGSLFGVDNNISFMIARQPVVRSVVVDFVGCQQPLDTSYFSIRERVQFGCPSLLSAKDDYVLLVFFLSMGQSQDKKEILSPPSDAILSWWATKEMAMGHGRGNLPKFLKDQI